MDKMAMKDTAYAGCVEAGGAPGALTLSHLAADDQMGKDAMGKGVPAFTVTSLKMVAASCP
jgi:hypothetical protein